MSVPASAAELLRAAGLTETQRQYLTLYCRDGMTMYRIAEIYGVNVSTVSRTISRASSRLRRAEMFTQTAAAARQQLRQS